MEQLRKRARYWETRSTEICEYELENGSLVLLLLAMLKWQIDVNVDLPLPTWKDPISMFCASSEPGIDTESYLKRMVKYTNCSRGAFIAALVYLKRIAEKCKLLAPTIYNMHRLLTTSVMIAAKILDDRQYITGHYARVGGLASAKELNRLELQMMKLLDFRVLVFAGEYECIIYKATTRCIPVLQPKLQGFEASQDCPLIDTESKENRGSGSFDLPADKTM